METTTDQDIYSWLKQEVLDIKTRKFHVFEELNNSYKEIENHEMLPKSYLKFISEFGGARLYRVRNSHQLGVHSTPKEITLVNGEKVIRFGHFDDESVYFRCSELSLASEPHVYELPENTLIKVAESFSAWICEAAQKARSSYKKKGWKKILEGPPPFSSEELEIVEARRKFDWKIATYDDEDYVVFSVKNNSKLNLPFLTIGVIAKDKLFEGAVFLDTSDINPGQEKFVKRDVYKDITKPNNLDIFSLPDPWPEDREQYWEFRKR